LKASSATKSVKIGTELTFENSRVLLISDAKDTQANLLSCSCRHQCLHHFNFRGWLLSH